MKDFETFLRQMDATAEERQQVEAWIAAGNDFNGNPYDLFFENGSPMDFISALRSTLLMAEEKTS